MMELNTLRHNIVYWVLLLLFSINFIFYKDQTLGCFCLRIVIQLLKLVLLMLPLTWSLWKFLTILITSGCKKVTINYFDDCSTKWHCCCCVFSVYSQILYGSICKKKFERTSILDQIWNVTQILRAKTIIWIKVLKTSMHWAFVIENAIVWHRKLHKGMAIH